MTRYGNVLEAIGHTPNIRLARLSPKAGADIYAKCEFLNPGGSVKDRMALHIIRKAMERGDIKPGGVIVENTSGNTGVGLALIAAVYGCRLIVTMPDKMSQEKIDILRALGAKVVVTPTNVPADHPESYYETAKRIAREIPGAFYVNQYHNPENIEAHYLTTGPEIWEDMEGKIDAVVIGMGTGGSISGVGKFLKEKAPRVQVIGVDPVGSVFYDLFKHDKMTTPKVYKVEGIGEDMACDALDFSVVDDVYQVTDKECFLMTRRLAREEGLFAGGSSGAALAVAVKVAQKLGPGKNVVVIMPDAGNRYLSRVYNDEWMRVNGFLEDEEEKSVQDVIANKKPSVLWAAEQDEISSAVEFLRKNDISQAPVHDAAGRLTGCVTESAVLSALVAGSPPTTKVGSVMTKRPAVVDPHTPLSTVSEMLLGQPVVLVGTGAEKGNISGVLSKIDIIEFFTSRH